MIIDPCKDCIALALCVNRSPLDLLKKCYLIKNYLRDRVSRMKVSKRAYFPCCSKTLNKDFLLYCNVLGTVYTINRYKDVEEWRKLYD